MDGYVVKLGRGNRCGDEGQVPSGSLFDSFGTSNRVVRGLDIESEVEKERLEK